MENYGPVRLTRFTSLYLLESHILSGLQCDLPLASSLSQTPCLMDNLTLTLDDRMVSHAIFTEFGNAFDRVPHMLLLYNFETYENCAQLLTLVCNLLSDRSVTDKLVFHSSIPLRSLFNPDQSTARSSACSLSVFHSHKWLFSYHPREHCYVSQ